jgi:hypothetical protein
MKILRPHFPAPPPAALGFSARAPPAGDILRASERTGLPPALPVPGGSRISNNVVHVVWVAERRQSFYFARRRQTAASIQPRLVNLSEPRAMPIASAGARPARTASTWGWHTGLPTRGRSSNAAACAARRRCVFTATQLIAGVEGGFYSRITVLFTDSANRGPPRLLHLPATSVGRLLA